MADEIRKVITVDVSGAVESLDDMREEVEETGYSFRSLGDAKKYIDKLRASLIDLDETSDEYADRVGEIDVLQDKLNKAMKVTGTTIKNAEGSYNALSKQMSELKKAFKATNDEVERQEIAKKIVGINDQLKEMDASIGNYQRNVGNYEAAFTKGLEGISKRISELGNPLAIAKKGVTALSTAFKTLIANPVGAVIMAIVAAVKLLKSGFDKSEVATNSLKRAFAALEPVVNAISNVMTGFARIVGSVAEKAIPALVNGLQSAAGWMMNLLNKLGIVSDEKLDSFKKSIEAQKEMVKTTQDLTNREIDLEKKRRDLTVETAKKELEISELRAKSANKEKYSAAERQKFLEQAIATERSLNKSKLTLAQEEYDILKRRSELTDNDAETNDRLAQAEANLYNTKKEYYDKERKLVSQLSSANSEAAKSTKDATDDELKEIQKINERVELELMDGEKREETILTRKYEAEKALLEAYGFSTVKLTEEYNRNLEKLKEDDLKKIEEIGLRMKESGDRDIATLTKTYEEEKKLLEKYNKDTTQLTEEYNEKVANIRAKEKEKSLKDIDDEYELRRLMISNEVGAEENKNIKLAELNVRRLEDEKKLYEDLAVLDNLSIEQKEEYTKKVELLEQRIREAMQKTEEERNKQQKSEEEKLEELINNYGELAAGIGGILSDIGDYWMDSVEKRIEAGEISEEEGKKEFENTKKVQIAGAIITGLAGVATALSGAFTTKTGPWDLVLAGVQAASIAASTALQVAKIKSTQLGSSGSGGSVSVAQATPTAEATAYTPQYSTNITGQSETVNLANAVTSGQKDQRVYVVESDINEVGKKVQVRESESTF